MKYLKKTFFIVALSAFPYISFSQGDTGPPCGNNGDPEIDCPIDSGVIALLAAGALFGIKKLAVK